jgi:ABC-type antimicrobial peptide transport system permease subunit
VLVTQLWGVNPNDPVTLGFVVALIAGVGLTAGLVPARHAAHIDPIIGLRSEP